ncbi:MAG: response regulator [Gammaproteobacteria bacterium]
MIQFRNQTPSPVSLLVVDDDDVDIMAIRRAMKKLGLENPIRTAHTGIEALDVLRGGEQTERIPSPYIIVLDLNMPMMDGIGFLDELRSDEALRESVVFVLSTSDSQEDMHRAYRRNVAGYIVKARRADAYTDALRMLETFCSVVELPHAV